MADTPNDQPATESHSAFARRIGVSQQYISRLVKRGLPVDSNNRVVTSEALSWLKDNVTTFADADNGDGENGGLTAARIRLIERQIRRADVEIERLRDSLIDKEAARRAVRQFARNHRDHMLRFAARHGPGIAAELGVDAATLVGLVEARIREALNEAADNPVPFEEARDA